MKDVRIDSETKAPRCEEILNYLLKAFSFILNECKGHIFNPKDEKHIANNLRFIAESGTDEYIKKTYILLLFVCGRAHSLGLSSERNLCELSRKFYNLRPAQCQKARKMMEKTLPQLRLSS